MKIFQKPMDWFRNLKTPVWLKRLGDIVQACAIDAFKILGGEATNYLKEQIFAQSKLDISGKDKFENVVAAFKSKYINMQISDRIINLAIELILAQLKREKIID